MTHILKKISDGSNQDLWGTIEGLTGYGIATNNINTDLWIVSNDGVDLTKSKSLEIISCVYNINNGINNERGQIAEFHHLLEEKLSQ